MVSVKCKQQNEIQKGLDQLVTVGDLQQFKIEIIAELKKVIGRGKGIPAKKWLKTVEVLKLLSISPGKLQTMRKSGAIAFTRIGGSLFYDQEDIFKMFEDYKTIDG